VFLAAIDFIRVDTRTGLEVGLVHQTDKGLAIMSVGRRGFNRDDQTLVIN